MQVCSRRQHHAGWASAWDVWGVARRLVYREHSEWDIEEVLGARSCKVWQVIFSASSMIFAPTPPLLRWVCIIIYTTQFGSQFTAFYTFPWWFRGSRCSLSLVRLWALRGQGQHLRYFAYCRNRLIWRFINTADWFDRDCVCASGKDSWDTILSGTKKIRVH